MLLPVKKSDYTNTRVDLLATNRALEFFQTDDRFLASRDVPTMLVSAPSGILSVLDTDDLNRDEVAVRARNAQAEQAGFGYKPVTYTTDERSLEYDVNAAQAAGAVPGRNPELVIPWALSYKANIHSERRFSTELWGTAKWYRAVTGAAADNAGTDTAKERAYWSDTTKDPIPGIRQEIDIFLKRTGMLPTRLRMGRELFTTLANHPLVRAQVSVLASGGGASRTATFTPPATIEQLSALCGVQISVSSAVRNTAGKGLAAANDFIIPSKSALLTYDAPATIITPDTPTGFARVAFTGLAPNGFQVRRFERPEIGAGGSMASVLDIYHGYVTIDNKLGTYWHNMAQ